MKKKLLCLIMTLIMIVGASMTVYAEDFIGSDDWTVSFTGEKMESNFAASEIDESILNIQPGDSILVKVNLSNDSERNTDWYMTNEVLESLEDAVTVAEGGAYTYKLTYIAPDGAETVLYDSEVVGGEDPVDEEGLHQATDSLEDYFYLDTLKVGEKAKVTLYVQLEGETQGNDYQDTLAQLRMNFAVELVEDGTIIETVKTGDASPILMFSLLALISGILILVIVIRRSKEKRSSGANLMVLLMVAALAFSSVNEVKAAEISKENPYQYTVTLYAGNKGEFTPEFYNVVSRSENLDIDGSADKIVISGLNPNDVITVNYQDHEDDANQGLFVTDEKYYAKGIRLSGRDNDDAGNTAAIVVSEDADYVVGYGIKGQQVAYTVNYVDADGNVLAEADTFYGNIGDKPVVAYKYIEGYVPEVVGFTKTLSDNAAENVFTFVYDEAPTPTIIIDYVSGGGQGGQGGQDGQGGAGAGDDAQAGDGQEGQGGDDAQGGENQGGDEPEGPIVELDDPETPGGNIDVDGSNMGMVGGIAIAVAAGIALIILLIFLLKRRKENTEQQ